MNTKNEIDLEWTKQAQIVYGGLIGIGVIVLQALISTPLLDLASLISIVSFAVAIPFLAIMVLIYHAQIQYGYTSYPWYLTPIIFLGQGGAFLGVFAAFWHVSWLAGILLAISGIAGLMIYTIYLKELERDHAGESASNLAKGS